MELWNRFSDLFMQSEHFRFGFIWGVGSTLFVAWVFSWLASYIGAQWHRMRQFFQPTKQPVKIATEAGPSPASALMGCLMGLLILVLILGTVVGAVLWQTNSLGR